MKSTSSLFSRLFFLLAVGVLAPLALRAQTITGATGQVGVNYSYQVTSSATPPVIYAATGLPGGLAINASSGLITGVPTAAGTVVGSVSVTSGGLTNSAPISITINPSTGTPAITSGTSASGSVGAVFGPYAVTASNSPTSFNIGTLPAGLTVGGTLTAPTITGTPTTATVPGTPFQVSLSANNGSGTGATTILSLTIASAAGTPLISSSTLPASVAVNAALSYQIAASNSPTSYSASGLPAGVSLNATSGLISGTPTVAGVYAVSASATNGSGTGAAATITFTVGGVPAITSPLAASAVKGSAFSFALSASPAATSFNIGTLPAGLTANTATGLISGTPTADGVTSVSVSANNAAGTGAAVTLVITVRPPDVIIETRPDVVVSPTGVAPTITVSPVGQSVSEGSSVTFTVSATGTGLNFQWGKNGSPIIGALGPTLTLTNVTAADAGVYAVFVSNTGGSIVSDGANLTVKPIELPVITTQPIAQTTTVGGSARFTVVATGTGPLSYQWQKDGVAIAGATNATLNLTNVNAASAGAYRVIVTNRAGSVPSASVPLTVESVVRPPVIVTPPISQKLIVGTNATLTVVATGTPPLTYQWRKDGAAIGGATNATYMIPGASFSDAGSYTVSVTNSAGTAGGGAAITVEFGSRMVNLSTRGNVGAGDRVLIAGFVIQGSAPKPVLIRAVGPGLVGLGVTGILGDPVLELFTGATITSSNDNWGAASNAQVIASTASRVGAFALGATSADATLLVTLEPGNYTAQVRGAANSTGIGLVEIYDAGEATTDSRLINVATRGEVGIGANIMIAGFYIDGSQPKQVLVRAAGPALSTFGITNALTDPRLQLFSGTALRNENDNWGTPVASSGPTSAEIAAASAKVAAFAFAPGSRDAVLLLTLVPGAYSAQVSGVNNATGVALVEVYEVP